MKGKKEGGEQRERRGKKREGKKREKKKQSSTPRLEPATFHYTANCLGLLPGGRIAQYMYILQISILMA